MAVGESTINYDNNITTTITTKKNHLYSATHEKSLWYRRREYKYKKEYCIIYYCTVFEKIAHVVRTILTGVFATVIRYAGRHRRRRSITLIRHGCRMSISSCNTFIRLSLFLIFTRRFVHVVFRLGGGRNSSIIFFSQKRGDGANGPLQRFKSILQK